MGKKDVIDALEAAVSNYRLKQRAEDTLIEFMMNLAVAEAKGHPWEDFGGTDFDGFVTEGVARAFERLKRYTARTPLTPEHLVNFTYDLICGSKWNQNKNGKKFRRSGIFEIMIKQEQRRQARLECFNAPSNTGDNSSNHNQTLADRIASPTSIAPEDYPRIKRSIRMYVYHLERLAHGHPDKKKRLTFAALASHVKRCLDYDTNHPSSFRHTSVEDLLDRADLSNFDARLFKRAKSQWYIVQEHCEFLADETSRSQNNMRVSINRVRPYLYHLALQSEHDVLGVRPMCSELGISPIVRMI